jgi:hypothetical protein
MAKRPVRNIIHDLVRFLFEHLPGPAGVLYAPPNKDDSRKSCGNCFMWSGDKRCLIHDRDLEVSADSVCGYHVFGKPLKKWVDRGIQALDPALTGLEKVPGGTSCDLCMWFEKGLCLAVRGPDGNPAKVQAKGCCARWEAK